MHKVQHDMVFGQYRVLKHFGSYQQRFYEKHGQPQRSAQNRFCTILTNCHRGMRLLYEYDVITGPVPLAVKMYELKMIFEIDYPAQSLVFCVMIVSSRA